MNCDICQRPHHPAKLPFYCVVDARNALYTGRVDNARVLMEMEGLESRINKLLSDSDAKPGAPPPERNSRTYLENCSSELHQAKERTRRVIESADRLREDIATAKREIAERRARIARKKSDLASATGGIEARRNRELEETKKMTRMAKYSWDREYDALTQYRAALCLEVAKLYRLQRVRRGNPARYEYKIGGIDIIDLHQMNNVQPDLISASLGHISHLLWLTSHYLAIRLPAEITLPHNDYPRPTIFSLGSSYHHGEVAFPGTSPLPPDPVDRQFQHVPHPRPLYVDRPLSTLAKDDPSAYSAFLEGVSLLAYDIVWLCRTQGAPVTDGLDDFANLGRNMYNLLINLPMQRNQQHSLDTPGRSSEGGEQADLGKTAPRMGLYSHGTSHTSLSTAAGNKLTRSFNMLNPLKLADQLKAKLAQEMYPAAEWELVQNDGLLPESLEDAVVVGGPPPRPRQGEAGPRYGLESYMSVQSATSAVNREREKSNGWTKIKPRAPG